MWKTDNWKAAFTNDTTSIHCWFYDVDFTHQWFNRVEIWIMRLTTQWQLGNATAMTTWQCCCNDNLAMLLQWQLGNAAAMTTCNAIKTTIWQCCRFKRQIAVSKFAPFLFFFPCRKSAHRSWVTPLCIVWVTTLNSISSGICHQNTQFNMYTTTSKQQEGCTFEDSHPKCFITTNSTAKLSRGAVNRGDVHVLRASYTKINSNTVCNYFNFIWHNGLSLLYGNCSISLSLRSEKIT